ncbi:3-oxo-tetronate kinase [Marinivivus vitaminiproducens]|uniref:3-oxo-tetronate kinase n=1 Tax=Marinivivus vitaminiproducens TaxID=3035935 RepID=UPI0027A49667|nr:four-carbon acid sugar kinase family protein [Geminicoccaceae bacterium SCSIO 64248]
MTILLGAVADDFTGASDLANTLVKSGLRTVQLIGLPRPGDAVDADAVVVALKSRTTPVSDAVRESRQAAAWLREQGCRQIIFKYCSTFDSTEEGNIGPVAEALLTDLGADFTIACPSFPANGRTVFQGHLFVHDQLISESPMRHHPLTPMTDANLVRFLGKQTRLKVGLVPLDVVMKGPDAIRAAFAERRDEGVRIAVVDAVTDEDLVAIGRACAGLALVTGGSGVATSLGEALRPREVMHHQDPEAVPAIEGRAAVLSGSCSAATNRQVEVASEAWPTLRLDPLALADGKQTVADILAFALPKLDAGPVLIAATAPPDSVKAVQEKLGREAAGQLVEETLAAVARGLVTDGEVRRLVVAGGETSGAVVSALGIRRLRIGAEIAPGVPGTVADAELTGAPFPMALSLKSGNFGGPNFFAEALEAMP